MSNKVWIVLHTDEDGYTNIDGVFTSEEKALEYKQSRTPYPQMPTYFIEYYYLQ